MTDLTDTRLDAYQVPEGDQDRAGYQLADDHHATWALRRLAAHRAEVARLDALKAHEIDEIKRWHDAATAPVYGNVAFFERLLIDYRRRLEREDPGLKQTYRLPGGALTRKRARPRVALVDVDAFVAWAWTNDPEALKPSPLVSRLAPGNGYQVDPVSGIIATSDGERVPGVAVERDPDQYGATTDDA